MAQYIRLSDLQYPFFEGDIRNLHPEITDDQTGPTFPALQDFAVVAWSNPPLTSPPLEYAVEGPPEQIGNGWRMTWTTGVMTQEEWDAIQAPPPAPIDMKRDPVRLLQTGSAPDVE